jgi:hypothetical protein
MAHRVTFEIEHHDDEQFGALSPGYYGFAKASTDYAFNGPTSYPERYTLGEMPLDMMHCAAATAWALIKPARAISHSPAHYSWSSITPRTRCCSN